MGTIRTPNELLEEKLKREKDEASRHVLFSVKEQGQTTPPTSNSLRADEDEHYDDAPSYPPFAGAAACARSISAGTSDGTAITSMTGDTKARLFKVVKEQMKMVKLLTNATLNHSAELEQVRREKEDIYREHWRMQKGSSDSSNMGNGNGKGNGTTYKKSRALFGSITSASSIGIGRGRSNKKGDGSNKINYAAPLPEATGRDKGTSCASRCWASFAFACTFFIPNCLICKSGPAAKQAWREKVAICVCAVLVSAFFVGIFGFVPLFFCTDTETYSWQDIWAKDREAWTVIHGTIYDMKDYKNIHPGGADGIENWLGEDASRIFARTPPAKLPGKCTNPDMNKNNYRRWECVDMTELDKLLGVPCHKRQSKARLGVDKWLKDLKVGNLAYPGSSLVKDSEDSVDFDFIVIRDKVYNVTNYVNDLRNEDSGMIEEDHAESDHAYLTPTLHSLIVNKLNEDATAVYDGLYSNDDYMNCLDELFYVGVIDNRNTPACQALEITMYVMLIAVMALLVLQCICSLLYLARGHHTFTKKDGESPVMVMVPCYNEGDKELRKTIDSVVETTYPSDNKVMVVIADGNITGKGESMSTPQVLSKILGFVIDDEEDAACGYKSIGTHRENLANVYSGVYEKGDKSLKYIVVVKCGMESEQDGGRAGNRGKRDSQLIITGLFNRIHHDRELCELDSAINKALISLDVPANDIEYLMTIDADTRVEEKSIHHMVYEMNKNEKVLALCGETRVENKTQSWVTMLQVYEYYSSHHLKKAFESVFGCVTCLPGCFTMYRVFSTDGRALVSQDNVFSEYSRNDIESLHEKNLYLLGEDRMLTTLLLKNFPDMRLSFVPEAACWTIVPHTLSILLSQRRRWINSTFHNMLELLKVKTMCGICCFSMKTIVVLDLIGTMILPASMVYAAYFIYLVSVTGEEISMLMIILYCTILGVQMVIFLMRSRWDYLFWFIIFLVFGIPVFYFFLPIYSFLHMDDFSWGQTRQLQTNKTKQEGGGRSTKKRILLGLFLIIGAAGVAAGVGYGAYVGITQKRPSEDQEDQGALLATDLDYDDVIVAAVNSPSPTAIEPSASPTSKPTTDSLSLIDQLQLSLLEQQQPTATPTPSPSAKPTNLCGDGSRGNGICPNPSHCCSSFGWCGTGDAFCNNVYNNNGDDRSEKDGAGTSINEESQGDN